MSSKSFRSFFKCDPRQLVVPVVVVFAFLVFVGRLVYIQAIAPNSKVATVSHSAPKTIVAVKGQEDLAHKVLRKLAAARGGSLNIGRRIRNRLSRMR